MSRVKRTLISVVVVAALLFAVCTLRPAPARALDDTQTIIVVLGGTIGGLMILALIFTFFVRDNPAWMPAVPSAEAAVRSNPWSRPEERLRFGLRCGAADRGVPLLCW
jgi:hypothetical protein